MDQLAAHPDKFDELEKAILEALPKDRHASVFIDNFGGNLNVGIMVSFLWEGGGKVYDTYELKKDNNGNIIAIQKGHKGEEGVINSDVIKNIISNPYYRVPPGVIIGGRRRKSRKGSRKSRRRASRKTRRC